MFPLPCPRDENMQRKGYVLQWQTSTCCPSWSRPAQQHNWSSYGLDMSVGLLRELSKPLPHLYFSFLLRFLDSWSAWG